MPEPKTKPVNMEHKELRLEIKQLNEDGTFEGMLATYGNVDLGGDVIERGAFDRTIKNNGGQLPILWQHKVDEPIGMFTELLDTPDGLSVKGALDLNVQRAREAYSLLKKRIVKGLSIGFDSIKDVIDGGIRHLKEIRLWEGSVVTFPMNLRALITAVKAQRTTETKEDFVTELQNIQLMAGRWQMMEALSCSLCDIVYDMAMTPEQKVAASEQSIGQFQSAYLSLLPDYLAMMTGMEMMSAKDFEAKAGRMISGANRSALERIMATMQDSMASIQALLDASDGGADGPAKSATPDTPKGLVAEPTDPDPLHSALISGLNDLRGALTWK